MQLPDEVKPGNIGPLGNLVFGLIIGLFLWLSGAYLMDGTATLIVAFFIIANIVSAATHRGTAKVRFLSPVWVGLNLGVFVPYLVYVAILGHAY